MIQTLILTAILLIACRLISQPVYSADSVQVSVLGTNG